MTGRFNKVEEITPFTQSLDACFKWLVPKLDNLVLRYRHYNAGHMGYEARTLKVYDDDEYDTFLGIDKNPALALCLVIEKLIDNKGTDTKGK